MTQLSPLAELPQISHTKNTEIILNNISYNNIKININIRHSSPS